MRRLYHQNAYDPALSRGNYWNTTPAPAHDGPLSGDVQTEVAIVGAGFTGLNAALTLAQTHQREVVVLDASAPGWGASGRNGGFATLGGGMRSDAALRARYGATQTDLFHQTQREAIQQVADFLTDHHVDADRHSDGEWQVAHHRAFADALHKEAEHLRSVHGGEAAVVAQGALRERGMDSPECVLALHQPLGFALNPRKYVNALHGACVAAGARVFAQSPVIEVAQRDNRYALETDNGRVIARHLIIGANGYAADNWVAPLSGRYLPAISNIAVTRTLSADEIAAQGWHSDQMAFDSRTLLHYFRLLPEGRMLFGMRGGLSMSDRAFARARRSIRRDFNRFFPAWCDVEFTHFWSGLVCLNRALSPYVGPLGDWPNAWTGFGFHGNGVAYASWTGRTLANLCAGTQRLRDLPTMLRETPRPFPLPHWRLGYLAAAYGGLGAASVLSDLMLKLHRN